MRRERGRKVFKVSNAMFSHSKFRPALSRCDSEFLSFSLFPGHLAARGDFIYANEQRSTFNYINVAPQVSFTARPGAFFPPHEKAHFLSLLRKKNKANPAEREKQF